MNWFRDDLEYEGKKFNGEAQRLIEFTEYYGEDPIEAIPGWIFGYF